MPVTVTEKDGKTIRLTRLMAAAALTKQGKPADEASIEKLSNAIMKQPSFAAMKDDPRCAKLMQEGRGADLCALFAEKDRELNGPRGPYARPAFAAKEDASFLKTAVDSMKGGEIEGSPAQIERESALLAEMTKRLDHAQELLEKGIPLSEKDTAELVSTVKRYNDGGTKVPGGTREAAYSKQAMCVLKRYMPQEEFNAYCGKINAARGAYSPASRGYVEPKNFTNDVLTGDVRSAKELMAESRKSLSKKLTADGCAAAAAIQRLSGGNPAALISKKKLQEEIDSYKKPGSAFMEVMRDPTARDKLASLASKGLAGKLGSTVVEESRKYSARAAKWQIDQAAASAGAGRGTKQTMAEMLAAKELEYSSDPAAAVTKDAFAQKAKEIAESPAFAKLSQRYDSDPGYRTRMDREIAAGDKNNTLSREYEHFKSEPTAERERTQQGPTVS